MLRRGQDRFRRAMPGGFGGGKSVILIVLVAVAVWLASGFYRVQPGEQGVELVFGEFVKTTSPGLNYWFPSPIGEVIKPDVERINTITIGYRGSADRSTVQRDVETESLMLTGDQNVIDIDFVVQWRIKDAANFLFQLREPEGTVKIAAESAIREVIGQSNLEEALTVRRQIIEDTTEELLQRVLDSYNAGVHVADIKMQKVDPPQEVIDAFNDVQRARQDQERLVNEALAYKNDIVPRAKGRAEQILAAAKAYKEEVIKNAEGEAARFLSVYNTYKDAKDVTTRRLFLERMQQVLKGSEKVIIDRGQGGQGVVPYLPLPEIQKRSQSNTGSEGR